MLVMVMVMVIYSALVRSYQSTSLVALASCVPRGYTTRAQPCLKMWRGSPEAPPPLSGPPPGAAYPVHTVAARLFVENKGLRTAARDAQAQGEKKRRRGSGATLCLYQDMASKAMAMCVCVCVCLECNSAGPRH